MLRESASIVSARESSDVPDSTDHPLPSLRGFEEAHRFLKKGSSCMTDGELRRLWLFFFASCRATH